MTNLSSRPKVLGILQARMGSSRLPGKVLANVLDQPLLAIMIGRVREARGLDGLVLATSYLRQDDPLADLAAHLGVPCFRGAEDDCLDRYYRVAELFDPDHIVRLTGDCPLLDAAFLGWVINEYVSADPPYDYVDSSVSKSFPIGIAVEVFSRAALVAAWAEDDDMRTREHVTPFIYKHPERFGVHHLVSQRDLSGLRLTVDTAEDLALVRLVFEFFGHTRFSWEDAVAVLHEHPEWTRLNRHVQQKTI